MRLPQPGPLCQRAARWCRACGWRCRPKCTRTHEELVERILHAGLAYSDVVDPDTSLVICNDARPEQGKGYQAHELGVPPVSDADFMRCVDGVVGGTGIEDFTDTTPAGEQFALF